MLEAASKVGMDIGMDIEGDPDACILNASVLSRDDMVTWSISMERPDFGGNRGRLELEVGAGRASLSESAESGPQCRGETMPIFNHLFSRTERSL